MRTRVFVSSFLTFWFIGLISIYGWVAMGFWTITPGGNQIHIDGNVNMPEETLIALQKLFDAAISEVIAGTQEHIVPENDNDACPNCNGYLRFDGACIQCGFALP